MLTRADVDVDKVRDRIGIEIKDAFALGRLGVWGRLVTNRDAGKPLGETPPLRKIDHKYWHCAHFTYSFFDNTAGYAPHTYVGIGYSEPGYTDLRVNRAEAFAIWPLTSADTLKIIIGAGGDFETRKSSGLYTTNHTFSVCVQNSDQTKFVSNCKLYLNIANEKDHGRKDYFLEGPSPSILLRENSGRLLATKSQPQ